MPPLTPADYLSLAGGVIDIVAKLTEEALKLKALAAKTGATHEELMAIDAKLQAAKEARQAEGSDWPPRE